MIADRTSEANDPQTDVADFVIKEIQRSINDGQSTSGAICLFCNDFGMDLMEVQTIVYSSQLFKKG